MKLFYKILLIHLLLSNSISAKVFTIVGKITGKEKLKFAYAFNTTDGSLIQIVPIVNNAFALKGEIAEHNRFGSLPTINVLLLADSLSLDEIERRRLTSKRKHYNCNIVADGNVSLAYDTEKKVFTVGGTDQNFVQNLYLNRLALYRNTRDSLFDSIRQTDLSPDAKNERIDQIGAELFTSAMRDFIEILKRYPDEVSLNNFDIVVYDQGIRGKDVLCAFNLFPIEIRNSQYGKSIYKDIEDKVKMETLVAKHAYLIGQAFPNFELPDANEVRQSGHALYGKYTLIDFWATWCGPCRAETPHLTKAFKDFHSKGFNVVTVSLDAQKDREKWIRALTDDKMEMLSNLFNGDDSSGLARELKILAIPMNFLIDEQGKIIATNLRGQDLLRKLTEVFGK